MAVPQLVRRTAEKALAAFVERQNAAGRIADGRLAWSAEEESLLLFLTRPAATLPLVRFRFVAELGQWTLHYRDDAGRWCFYLNAGPTLEFGKLLAVVDSDPFNFFWPD
ncbi:hypothetical protein JCM30471_26150 [Desulfuromonas carbonis]|uniref:DUF3024 domain-containing protein n=1 Tax=Desulfuromonas sp. DDH964 TaxID=1823759 RepID=UPI00078E9523|nr:DUF3024 domain-containing protein [Desulfuromonas sp. DDH964]AMV70807.1 hypothetical protein DBW_0405 [Desulfuromonas sp. DDH964]